MTTSSYESLSHSKWDCKYHLVFIPKGRKKDLYGKIRSFLKPIFHELASQRGSTILSGSMVQDHVHMLIKIPPKYAVADVVAQLKSQSASTLRKKFTWLARVYWKENIVWSPGYFASTVGADEATIKRYVEHQGLQDEGQQLTLLG